MDTLPDVQIVVPYAVDGHILINGDKINLYTKHRRTHYKTSDFIVKIDARTGCKEAKHEIELWEDTLDEEDRKHFVPILCGSIEQRWVCQEYVEITQPTMLDDEVRIEIWNAIIKPLMDKYLLSDVSSIWNWGIIDGVPMIYDYGQ